MTRHLSLLLMGLCVLAGCRGNPSREPPVHLNQNMDYQDKYKPQRESHFFADGRTMRTPPAGTVGRDVMLTLYGVQTPGLVNGDDRYLRENNEYWRGCKTARCDRSANPTDTNYIEALPEQLTDLEALVARGQGRFNIYCSACHGRTGYGDGVVSVVGKLNARNLHLDHVRQFPAGYIYDVISNGAPSGLMQGMKHQIPVEDRWAIVSYVRALQLSQFAQADDRPAEAVEETN